MTKRILVNYVAKERSRKGITIKTLADQTGVSIQTINSIEAERYEPSITLALSIAEALDMDVHYLFRLEESESSE